MCTQLSADSPLGPQVASSPRYCQLERSDEKRKEGGREREMESRQDVEGKVLAREVVEGGASNVRHDRK